MSVITFDSWGMEMEPRAKRGGMIQTKVKRRVGEKQEAPKVRCKNRTLVAYVLICQSAKKKLMSTQRGTKKTKNSMHSDMHVHTQTQVLVVCVLELFHCMTAALF